MSKRKYSITAYEKTTNQNDDKTMVGKETYFHCLRCENIISDVNGGGIGEIDINSLVMCENCNRVHKISNIEFN